MRKILFFFLMLVSFFSEEVLGNLKVVSTIRPIHSIVEELLEGVSKPELLLDGKYSPHTFNFLPKDAKKLHEADVIIWVGPELEGFLEKSLKILGSSKEVICLLDNLAIEVLHREHSCGGGCSHEKAGKDPHLWLSPLNMKIISQYIADAFIQLDPENKERYLNNCDKVKKKLDDLYNKCINKTKKIQGVKIYFFHDGYQYFGKDFGLTCIDRLSNHPESPLGANDWQDFIDDVLENKKSNRVIFFGEEQLANKDFESLAKRLGCEFDVVDPYGVAGQNYYKLITDLVEKVIKYTAGNR